MKTVNIKGKEYVEVNERIKYFRKHEDYKGWSLESEIISIENGVCIIKAIIKDNEGIIKATGLAYEKENSTFINKTSYIENCETSAWGRALGNLGIGIDTSIASSNEVENAIINQKKAETVKTQMSVKDEIRHMLDNWNMPDNDRRGYKNDLNTKAINPTVSLRDEIKAKYGQLNA